MLAHPQLLQIKAVMEYWGRTFPPPPPPPQSREEPLGQAQGCSLKSSFRKRAFALG